MKTDTKKVGKKSDRLQGVRITYGTKMKAVYPNTGMKASDRGIDTQDAIKIANSFSRVKRIDTIMGKVARITAFIIIFSAVVAIFFYLFGR